MNQLATIPTNSVPASSALITNYLFINLTNMGPCYVFTNYNAASSLLILKPTLTLTTWP
jgi:energy-converting hydrogenase Eha subunit E